MVTPSIITASPQYHEKLNAEITGQGEKQNKNVDKQTSQKAPCPGNSHGIFSLVKADEVD